jgi:hypothetical protein
MLLVLTAPLEEVDEQLTTEGRLVTPFAAQMFCV